METRSLVKSEVLQLVQGATEQFSGRLAGRIEPRKFTLGILTVLQKNPDLLACEPKSVLLAAYEAAELGVSLSPTLQLGYLIPYKGKAHFQISWRGLVQKAYETGCIRAFYAEVVYANDKFERQYAPKRNLFHAPAPGDRGEAVGAYGHVEFVNGVTDWEFCEKKLIERHQKHSKQPDSLMWREFWEEAWKKTAIRLLAKRLPLSNPGMERLAEVVERDAQADAEPEASGKIELEPDSVLLSAKPAEKTKEIAPQREQEANAEVFYQVGPDVTTVSGRTLLLKDSLPKIGAKWDGDARVWTMPAARTHELLAACEEKGLRSAEVVTEKSKEAESEMLWPREK